MDSGTNISLQPTTFLLAVAMVSLVVYSLVDLFRFPDDQVRYLPRAGWVFMLVLTNLLGVVLWWAFGRPRRSRPQRFMG